MKSSFFHLIAFPGDTMLKASERKDVEGFQVNCLCLDSLPSRLDNFGLSFEEALARLNELDRMFVELDGAFVWMCMSPGRESQIDGLLNDLNDRVISIELKGSNYLCLDEIFKVFGWPTRRIVIQDVRRGLFFDEPDYRGLHQYLSAE